MKRGPGMAREDCFEKRVQLMDTSLLDCMSKRSLSTKGMDAPDGNSIGAYKVSGHPGWLL